MGKAGEPPAFLIPESRASLPPSISFAPGRTMGAGGASRTADPGSIMLPRIDEEITFRKLEILLAFLESGNLARAAEQLGPSAVSVHRALHSLETGARCALFRHEGRNLQPNESAHALAEVARDVLRTM